MGKEQGRRCYSNLGISSVDIVWSISFLIGLVTFSYYVVSRLRLQLQELTSSAIIENFHLIEYSIYSVAGLAVVLMAIIVLILFRRLNRQGDDLATVPQLSGFDDDQQRLYLLLDSAPCCIYMKDTDLHYTFANRRWLETYGLTLESILGKSEIEVFGETDSVIDKIGDEKRIVDGAAPIQKEIQVMSGEELTTLVSDTFPLNSDNGELVSVGGWARDISHYKRTYQELEKARKQADELNTAKSSFLAAMSHEIRTPMNGVVGSLDLLRVSKLDDSQKQLIDTVNESAFSLLTIINDILDFSKIESGKLEFDLVPVSLERLLVSVAASLIPNAQKKGVELLVFTDVDMPDVNADLVRLRQIITNLVSNAIKFTNKSASNSGRVIVRCAREDNEFPAKAGMKKAIINISVEDNGIGISEEAQTQLFQPFVQAEGSTTRRFGGSGLGLSITSRLVEMMEGEISVESTLGSGSKFSVSLPLALIEAAQPKEDEISVVGLPVLFVKGEDDTITEIFTRYLSSGGVICSEVTRNIDEWRDLPINTAEKLVIVIVDCWANDLSLPVLKHQLEQQFSSVKHLSFIILSHLYLLEPQRLTDNTIQLAYNGLGRKSFLKAIDSLANQKQIAGDKSNMDLTAEDQPSKIIAARDNDQLLLIAEDNEVNQKVLRHQAGVLGYSVEIANDGLQALSMWEKNKNKYQLILTDCHMPNLDGYGLAKAIRSRETEGKRIPILAITADALQGTDDLCFQAGMDDYLTKPLLIKDLSYKLEKWLVTDQMTNRSVEHTTSHHEEQQAVAVDASVLPGYLGTTDESLIKDFYLEYQRTASLYVSEMHLSLCDENFAELAALGHKLQSSSYTVGALLVADDCKEIELAARRLDEQGGGENDRVYITEKLEQLQAHYSETDDWIEKNCSTVKS